MTKAMRSYQAELVQALAEEGRRLTRPRLLVLKVLAETEEHLSAETIYEQLSQQGNISSRASVYRALKLLERKGLARRLPMKEGPCRFECVRNGEKQKIHCHLVCQRCGRLMDVEAPGLDKNLLQVLQKPLKIEVNDYEVRLFGTCTRCVREAKHEKQ